MAEFTTEGLERVVNALESIAESLKKIAEKEDGPCMNYGERSESYCCLAAGHRGLHQAHNGLTWGDL